MQTEAAETGTWTEIKKKKKKEKGSSHHLLSPFLGHIHKSWHISVTGGNWTQFMVKETGLDKC